MNWTGPTTVYFLFLCLHFNLAVSNAHHDFTVSSSVTNYFFYQLTTYLVYLIFNCQMLKTLPSMSTISSSLSDSLTLNFPVLFFFFLILRINNLWYILTTIFSYDLDYNPKLLHSWWELVSLLDFAHQKFHREEPETSRRTFFLKNSLHHNLKKQVW